MREWSQEPESRSQEAPLRMGEWAHPRMGEMASQSRYVCPVPTG
jgi:hypothetical protein